MEEKKITLKTRKELAKYFNAFLHAIGKNPTDLGRDTGLNVQRLYKVARGESYLSLDAYEFLCEFYNADANFFIGRSSKVFLKHSPEELKAQQNYKLLYEELIKENLQIKETISAKTQTIAAQQKIIAMYEESNKK